ncbi:MAG: DUF362 domain-containing protein, partial [Bacteroidota bacterium]
SSNLPYQLVAVRGGEPAAMFDQAIEAYGGMKMFVKKGQRVLVKPNIGWDVDPERAGNTHPALVKRVIEHAFNAGAKEVFVFDHTCDNWTQCYKNSGIERAVKDAGGKIVTGGSEGNYQEVAVPRGKQLTRAKVHEQLLQADVFINVPVLKQHEASRLTIGMKNLMGVVWDRGYWHRNDLHQCIADFSTYRKPDLIVVDAYNVMKQNGPRGVSPADVVRMKAQLISTDPVAVDVAAAKLFGADPSDIRYIANAVALGVGSADLDPAAIKRIKI